MASLGTFVPAAVLAGCTAFFASPCPASAPAAPAVPAASAEYNPIPAAPVSLGPQANRLLIGFRATPQNALTQTLNGRLRPTRRTVTLASTSAADAVAAAGRAGLALARSRQITPDMHVLFLQETLYGMNVEAALARLRADPSVQFAVVDERRYPLAVIPDDPLFVPNSGSSGPANGQWYMNTPSSMVITLDGNATMDLSATDAVSAWGITTGSDGVVIADVDTGVRFDHPDLERAGFGGRLLPGYDFVGEDYDPTNGAALGTYLIANDGDGWDPDPSDPGDWVSTTDMQNSLFASDTEASSSWHGTRVVGVMGALSNNGVGIAGMSWGAWILPVRALGKGGGYDSDIIAGIEWAAGLVRGQFRRAAGASQNPYPADIVNLSLGGGTDACASANGAAYESALRVVTGLGVLVVVSAGNSNGPVELPGNCSTVVPGVMAVAGLRNVGTKVGYSSFGAQVSVSAPAGNCVASSGADCLRSIDTTTNLGATAPGGNSYTNEIRPQSRHELLRADRLGDRGAHEIGQQQPHPGATHRPHAGGRESLSRRRGGSAHLPEHGRFRRRMRLSERRHPMRSGYGRCAGGGRGRSEAHRRHRAARDPGRGQRHRCEPERRRLRYRRRAAGTAFHRLLRLVGRARGHHLERGGHGQGDHRSVSGNAHAHRHGQRRKQRHRDRDADGAPPRPARRRRAPAARKAPVPRRSR